ncbi:MAG TPA: O-antigen ligase family protein [Methylococcus sp.]|nr:O-antigen ligase family protein [Methylococcus sp.]
MLSLLTYPPSNYFTSAYKLSFSMLIPASLLVIFHGTGWVESASGGGYDSGRLHLDALNPISVGHLGVSLVLLAIWPYLLSIKPSWGRKQIMNVGAGLLGLYLLVASASRGPIVALVATLFFYLVAQDVKRYWKAIFAATLVLLVGNRMVIFFEETGNYHPLARIESSLSGKDDAVLGRQTAYKGAIDQFLQSPILGESLEERVTGFYPHNVILESFMATGLVGGLSFSFLILYGVCISFRLVKAKSEHGWISLIFMQYLIAAQFSGALYLSTTLWTFLSINIVLHSRRKLAPAKLTIYSVGAVRA